MKINKAYKVELDPNRSQTNLLRQHAGAARFAFNWGHARRIEEYKEAGKSSNAIELHKQLNKLKRSKFPWMYNISKCAPQEAFRNLDTAYKNFFRNVKQGKKPGFPKFKKKKEGSGSFRLTGTIKVSSDRIQLPRLGSIKLKESDYLPTSGVKILSATCSERAGHWFVSISCEIEIPDPVVESTEVLGIDLGIKTLAVCSDGSTYENVKALGKKEKPVRRAHKNVSRKVKGSKNRKKAVKALALVYYRVANIRKDHVHKVTSEIVKTKPSQIVLEDLSISNMVKNHKLAKSLCDASLSEFRRQIEYKAKWAGIEVVIVDRFFPSSKLCSVCRTKNDDLTLKDRKWTCSICGTVHDRDLNAAMNLRSYTGSSSGLEACGDNIRPEILAFVDEAGTNIEQRYIA